LGQCCFLNIDVSKAEEARLAAKRMEAEAKLAEEARRAVEIEAAKPKKKAVIGDAHPWSALSPSALKRRTAADLSEFLEERVR